MTQENEERRHVPLKDLYSVDDAAILLRISKNKVYEYASRSVDPLPFRRLHGTKRGMFISRHEFGEWVLNNSALVASLEAMQDDDDGKK